MLLYVLLACVSVTNNSPESQATELFGRLFSRVFGCLFGKAVSKSTRLMTREANEIPNRRESATARFVLEKLATPPPAQFGDEGGSVLPDPSLPTTGWRDRGAPSN